VESERNINSSRKVICFQIMFHYIQSIVSRDCSVGIASRYKLDSPGIDLRCERDFPHPSRPALRTTPPPTQWVPGLSRGEGGVKRPGRGVDHTPLFSAEIKERVEL